MPRLSKKAQMTVDVSDSEPETLLSESEPEMETKVTKPARKTARKNKKPAPIEEETAEEETTEEVAEEKDEEKAEEPKKSAKDGYVKYSTPRMRLYVEVVQAVLSSEEFAGVDVRSMRPKDYREKLAVALTEKHKELFDLNNERKHEQKLKREYNKKLEEQKPAVLDDETDPMFYPLFKLDELKAYADTKGIKYPKRPSKAKMSDYLTGKDTYFPKDEPIDKDNLEQVLQCYHAYASKPLSERKKVYAKLLGVSLPAARTRKELVIQHIANELKERFGDEFTEDMLNVESTD